MIDLHTHVLPGVDDGPAELEGSLAMARVAAADGVSTVVATPHASWTYQETTGERVRAAVADLETALADAGVALEVRPGAEVALTRAADLSDDELAGLRLGGGPWLLVECPLTPVAAGLEGILHHLQVRGHRVVLAHPERSPALQRDIAQVERLVAAGMLCSITAGSLVGAFGRTVQRFTFDLLRAGLVHNVTSDAHDAHRRPPLVAAALQAAERDLPGLGALARWLTHDVPQAVLDGTPVPPAPAPAPGTPRRRLLRRAGRSR